VRSQPEFRPSGCRLAIQFTSIFRYVTAGLGTREEALSPCAPQPLRRDLRNSQVPVGGISVSIRPILHQLAEQRVSPQEVAGAIRTIARKHAPQQGEASTPLFRSLCSVLWLFQRKQHPERIRSVKPKNVKKILGPDAEADGPGNKEPTSGPIDDDSEQSDDLDVEDALTESERAAADFEK
jgi:hypothetical protein